MSYFFILIVNFHILEKSIFYFFKVHLIPFLIENVQLDKFIINIFYILKVPLKVNVTVEQEQWPEGSDISISCHVDGYPIDKVQWYKDDVPLKTNNHIRVSGK